MDPKILPASAQTRPYAVLLSPGSVSEEGDRKLGESTELLSDCTVHTEVHCAWQDEKAPNSVVKISTPSCVFCHLLLIICLLPFVFIPFFLPRTSFVLLHSLQTNIGSILAAVNPYKQIAGLYEGTAVDLYSKHQMGELPPHIFAVANECYRCLWKRHDSQCVLIR